MTLCCAGMVIFFVFSALGSSCRWFFRGSWRLRNTLLESSRRFFGAYSGVISHIELFNKLNRPRVSAPQAVDVSLDSTCSQACRSVAGNGMPGCWTGRMHVSRMPEALAYQISCPWLRWAFVDRTCDTWPTYLTRGSKVPRYTWPVPKHRNYPKSYEHLMLCTVFLGHFGLVWWHA